MKKIIAFLLIIASLFAMASCSESFYEPVESTELEAKTVMTLKYGTKTYEVKYELYRAFFLTYKSEVDGGDPTVWSGTDKDKYVAEIQKIITEKVIDIYSTFALASSLGIDPYSTEVGKQVNEYIKLSVDGGDIGGVSYPGYGSYDAYLASLKALGLNYSVQTLLFRYSIVTDMIDDYYIGDMTEDDVASGELSVGALKYTEDDVRNFYESDECVRVLRTFISDDIDDNPLARAERVRAAIAAAAEYGEESVRIAMIDEGSLSAVPELEGGFVIGKYNLAGAFFGEMVDAAFALSVGEVSEVITVHDGIQLAHYIMYRTEKSDEHFEEYYPSIAYIYLRNKIGEQYKNVADEMSKGVTFLSFLDTLDHGGVSME